MLQAGGQISKKDLIAQPIPPNEMTSSALGRALRTEGVRVTAKVPKLLGLLCASVAKLC